MKSQVIFCVRAVMLGLSLKPPL